MVQETETIILHNYQTEAVNFVLDNIDNSNVLLAAAPNAGKTFMASFVINELIKNNKRVLCSVHGTNILKKQFYNSICEIVGFENISVYDVTDLSLYDSSKPVQVMIYQNIKQMEECVSEFGKFDYLIVDEAHKFYDGNNMETICSKFVIGNHLLLTGSPTTFKERVDSGEIVAKYISASLIESVHEGQYDKDIILDVVSNDVHLTTNDYNQDGEVISKSEHKLKNNELILDSLLVDDFGKTIIFVKQISQANKIERYLNKRNILNFISHSEVDKDSVNIYEFRNNYTGVDNVVLIVVGRATEGFDDPNVSIIDITYSKNVDTLYQRYSRAIRKRVDSVNKRYVKVVPNNDNSAEVFIHIMTAVLMLLKQEHYENFNGKNFSIPTLRQIVKTVKKGVGTVKSYVEKPKHETNDINDCDIIIKSSDEPQSVKDLVENDNFIVNVKIEDVTYEIKKNDYDSWVEKLDGKNYLITINKSNDKIDDELLMETKLYSGSFFDIKSELYGLITRYATNNLYDVLREINGEFYATEEEHIKFIKENNITGNRDYTKLYKIVKNLHSNPWRKFGNGSIKDYFESIWGKKEEFATEEEHIKFIKENNIKSVNSYFKLYKSCKSKLHSIPWKTFGNGSPKDYFKSIWESIEKEKIQREYKPAFLGEFSEMNKKWNTSNSKTTHKNLKKDKAEWLKYHELYSKARNNWDEIPYKVIANKIKNRPEWLVGDFGCGENLLSKEITNKVFSFDHIAIDETVTSCDLCKVPLNDEILDVVVFSLSLMGTNYKEYFKEAYRTLKTYGSLLISEPSTRWEDKEDNLKEMLEEAGFKIIGDIKHSDRFIYVDAIKY